MGRPEGVGVAFCGGGFRSYAEVAALEDMERNNVQIAAVAGTSMGSLLAVLTASGASASRIAELLVAMDREVVAQGLLRNMQLKVLNMVTNRGLVASSAMERIARDTLDQAGVSTMSDLKMPIALPAVDITSGELCVFTNDVDLFGDPSDSWTCLTGDLDLAKCMVASASYPLAISPTDYLGRTFMDGGCRMNLPTPLFDRMQVDAVVGIGMERQMQPLAEVTPLAIAQRTMSCGANQLDRLYAQSADIYINLPVSGDDAFQAGTGQQVIAEARQMMRDNPVDWSAAKPTPIMAVRRAAVDAFARMMRPQHLFQL